MTSCIIDSCALINICNCESGLDIIRCLPLQFWVQGLVLSEAKTAEQTVRVLIESGDIVEISGAEISVNEVRDIAVRYKIGVGEAECIHIAKRNRCMMLCDDKRARLSAQAEHISVVGTIGILIKCIEVGVFDHEEAELNLEAMRRAGGHLPKFDFLKRTFLQ